MDVLRLDGRVDRRGLLGGVDDLTGHARSAATTESAAERMWREHAEALRKAVEKQDAVIGFVTSYVDDLIDRAHDANRSPEKSAGAFALYVEQRLGELVKRVAEASRV